MNSTCSHNMHFFNDSAQALKRQRDLIFLNYASSTHHGFLYGKSYFPLTVVSVLAVINEVFEFDRSVIAAVYSKAIARPVRLGMADIHSGLGMKAHSIHNRIGYTCGDYGRRHTGPDGDSRMSLGIYFNCRSARCGR